MLVARPATHADGHAVFDGAVFVTATGTAVAVRRGSGEVVVRARPHPLGAATPLGSGPPPRTAHWRAWALAMAFALEQAAGGERLASAAIGSGRGPRPAARRGAAWRRLGGYRRATAEVLAAYRAGCPLELAAVRAHAALTRRAGHRWGPQTTATDAMREVALVALRAALTRCARPAPMRARAPLAWLGRPFAAACARRA